MTATEQEIDRFAAFARERVADGCSDLSLDDLFEIWRHENPSDELLAENIAAINASIEDFKNGERGTLSGPHTEQLRREYGLE